MKFYRLAIIASLLFGAFLGASPALAQTVSSRQAVCDPNYPTRCIKPNVDGSINTSGGGGSASPYVIAGNATLSASTTSANVALSGGGAVVVLTNTGSADAYIKFGNGAVTAAVTDFYLGAGRSVAVSGNSQTNVAAITASGTTTITVATGSGSPVLSGGGGGGSSGVVAQNSTTSGQSGMLEQCATTTAAPSYTTAKTNPISCDPAGGVRTVGRSFSTACAQMTLPATGAGAYAVGDLVANSATAGSVTPITCAVGSFSGASVRITKLQILTSTTGLTNASFLVHLYTSSPTVANGNDGAYSSTASGWFCTIPVTLSLAFSNGASGQGTPAFGADCTRQLSGTATVYALIQANSTYTWTNSMTFDLTAEGFE